jgi:hypothetical protein
MFGLLPERQYVRFNADALVRTDLRTRWEVNRIRVAMGAASIDEIRMQEDEPLLPDGQGQGFLVPQDPSSLSDQNEPAPVVGLPRRVG